MNVGQHAGIAVLPYHFARGPDSVNAYTDQIKTDVIKKKNSNYMLKIYGWNYLFILPGVIFLFIFSYIPIMGLQVAFKDYQIYTGIWKSPWNGLQNFQFLGDTYFWLSAKNTIILTIYRMAVSFPIPIILSLMINEVRSEKIKKFIQNTSYLPYFISWIVVAYMLNTILALDTGVVNTLLQKLGLNQVFFMGESRYFRSLVVLSYVWKNAGWGTIIYLAALSGIDSQLHEAATIDGAGRFDRIRYINIPGIMPTIIVLFILQMPSLLSAGYDQILPLVNPSNMSVSDVLDIYLIRFGLTQAQYNVATAIGLLLAIVNLFLVFGTNYICKKLGQESLW